MGLTAIQDEKNTVTVYHGYTIYKAPDDTLPPNPQDGKGYYYYAKYYWNDGQETIQDIYDFVDDEIANSPKCVVHFTVEKRIITDHGDGHRTKDYVGLLDVRCHIYRDGEKAIWESQSTDHNGVAVFEGVPLGKYDFKVITTGYTKENANVQNWIEEGEIYYKRIILMEETVYEDTGTTDDTTDTTGEEPPDAPPDETSEGDPVPDEDIDDFEDEDLEVVDTYSEDDDFNEGWDAPWTGGGQAQLDGTYEDYYDEGFSTLSIAVGVLGTTGFLMIVFAQMFMGRKT